jgi:hypothetical protein
MTPSGAVGSRIWRREILASSDKWLKGPPGPCCPAKKSAGTESLFAASPAFLYYGTRSGEGELFKNLCKNGFKSALVPMQSATQSATSRFAGARMMLRFACSMNPGALIETPESDGVFREP